MSIAKNKLYSSKRNEYFNMIREDIISLVPTGPNRVLEIGCGNGSTLLKIKETGRAAEIVGVDIVEFDTEIDRFIIGDIEEIDLDYPHEYFDVIICADLFEHLIDPWTVLQKLKNYLKPGGVLITSIPNIREIWTLSRIFFKGDFRYKKHGVLDRAHLRFFCKKNIVEFLKTGDLDIKNIKFSLGPKWKFINTVFFGLVEEFLVVQYVVLAEKKALVNPGKTQKISGSKVRFTCRICKNSKKNIMHFPREMMFGFREQFAYVECSRCNTLQLRDIPEDVSKYYPADYYSYQEKNSQYDGFIVNYFRKLRSRNHFYGDNPAGMVIQKLFGKPELYEWTRLAGIGQDASILDVGCGSGKLLFFMSKEGFSNLTGIDPFIEKDIDNYKNVKIYKKYLSELNEKYDFIMLHHSFEHMADPYHVLRELYRLLKPRKYILIRIPVIPSYVWGKYGINWFSLDAPRHFYIYSVKSMSLLAEKSGFKVKNIIYDSRDVQFWGSELYKMDMPFMKNVTKDKMPKLGCFTKKELLEFKNMTAELNGEGLGDMACFYLYKQ